MTHRRRCRGLVARALWLVLLVGTTSAEAADLTGFLQGGWPGGRSGVGVSVGLPVITEMFVVEAEFSNAGSSLGVSAFRSFAGSLRLTLPSEIGRFQPYVILGLGLYRQEPLSGGTSLASSQGGGSFIRLLGPLSARVDVRFFQLRGAPAQGRQQRFYVGGSLRF